MKIFVYFVIGFVSGLAATLYLSRQPSKQPVPASELSAQLECNEPVFMVVMGTIENRQALKSYNEALQSINAYPEQQGYYVMGSPLEIFEGEWPEDRMFITARFPCAEAARGFWFSEDYQSIRPLRAGAGPVSVSLHKVEDPPAWITGAAPVRLYEPRPTQPNP